MKTQKSLARYGIASKKTGGSIREIADFTGVTARFAQICLAFSSPSEKSGLTLQIRSMDRWSIPDRSESNLVVKKSGSDKP
jgi:hypothetical protein